MKIPALDANGEVPYCGLTSAHYGREKLGETYGPWIQAWVLQPVKLDVSPLKYLVFVEDLYHEGYISSSL